MPTSHSQLPDQQQQQQQQQQHITTYVRHRGLFDDDEEQQYAHRHGKQRQTSFTSKSMRLIGLEPKSTRTQATLHLLSDWEGRDAILQLAQSVTLLAFVSLAPLRRSKQLHLASEALANVRKVLVLGKWLSGGSEALQQAWWPSKTRRQTNHDDDSSYSSSSSEHSDGESHAQGNKDEDDKRFASRIHSDALQSWRLAWEARLETLAEGMVMVGEGCELAALLGGSGVLWRVIGGKLAARQRKGLERIALVFLALGFMLGLRNVQLQRWRRKSKLRQANMRLLRATDKMHGEADANTMFGAQRLSTEEALLLNKGAIQKRSGQTSEQASASNVQDEKSLPIHLQRPPQPSTSSQQGKHLALRKAERVLFLQRKEMQLLLLERASIRAELLFVIAELFWPRHDHTRLEAWTTLIAALCHMSRMSKEARWHA